MGLAALDGAVYSPFSLVGQVAEWLKAHAWKVCNGESRSRVRIPLCPPYPLDLNQLFRLFQATPINQPINIFAADDSRLWNIFSSPALSGKTKRHPLEPERWY